jgi:hypothetical protein
MTTPSTDAMVNALRDKVVELEAAAATGHARNLRTAGDGDRLTGELFAAKTNVEILTNNVATLKALSLQLAAQLEEARTEASTRGELNAVDAMRTERDAAAELSAIRIEYETRLERLRQDLSAQQAAGFEMRDRLQAADERQEAAVAAAVAAKDAIIADMQRQIASVNAAAVASVQPGAGPSGRASLASSVSSTGRRGHRKRPTGAGHHTVSSRYATDDDTDSWSPKPSHSILGVTVGVENPGDGSATARFVRGIGAMPKATSYFVDVKADPAALELVAAEPSENNSATAAGGVMMARQDGASDQRWSFLSATGEHITVAVGIHPLK